MAYVPSLTETVIVVAAASVTAAWASRRDPRARGVIAVAVLAAVVGVGAGALGVSMENTQIVEQARLGAMGVAALTLIVALGWAAAVRGWPVLDPDDDEPAAP